MNRTDRNAAPDFNSYFNGIHFLLMAEWAPVISDLHTSAATIEEFAAELLIHNQTAVKVGAHDAARKIRQSWAALRGAAVERAGFAV